MRVVVAGSRGFIGRGVVRALEAAGDEVVRLVRPGTTLRPGCFRWDPEAGTVDPAALDGADAVVNLAGAPVGPRPWTPAYRERILRSRVAGTRALTRALAALGSQGPGVLANASAIGWYGDRGDDVLTEAEPAGDGFRADVCRAWEAAAVRAEDAGVRVVLLRFGIVLGRDGGLLPVLAAPARLGIGTRLGDGRRFVSWVSLDDAVAGVRFTLSRETLTGPVNVTAPEPVRDAELAQALARTLGRPQIGWAPAPVLRLLVGVQRADEVLLSSQRAVPAALLEAGFAFRYEHVDEALRAALTGPAAPIDRAGGASE